MLLKPLRVRSSYSPEPPSAEGAVTKALLFAVTGAGTGGAGASKAVLFGVTGAPEEGATAAKATLFLIVDTTP